MTDKTGEITSQDYEALKKQLATTQQQNRQLQKIISLGNISTLSTLIEQYLAFSQVQLKKIAQEIQLTDYSRDNVEKVIRLLDHLDYAKKELHVFIDLHEEGIIGLNPRFQSCLFLATSIVRDLKRLGTLIDMSEERAEELHEMLGGFQFMIGRFIEQVREERS